MVLPDPIQGISALAGTTRRVHASGMAIVKFRARSRTRTLARLRLLIAALALVGLTTAGASASTSTSASTSNDNVLTSVAGTAASNLWAVGYRDNGVAGRTLITRRSGGAWIRVASPNPGGATRDNHLLGVAAVAASDDWAVGWYDNGTAKRTLTMHWNGRSWKTIPSPNPGGATRDNILGAVTAITASNVWAVGTYFDGTANRTLTMHWNGRSWKTVRSPNPGGVTHPNGLAGTAGVSASKVWSVGSYWNYSYFNGTANRGVIERWNGTSWKAVATPSPGGTGDNPLSAVDASSKSDVWAVGYYGLADHTAQTLVERWRGTSWSHVSSPNPGGTARANMLRGVVAMSASNVWAVGGYHDGVTFRTLVEHWNGTAWTTIPSPNVGTDDFLSSVAALSVTNIWAVGDFNNGAARQTLIEHWSGKSWRVAASPNA